MPTILIFFSSFSSPSLHCSLSSFLLQKMISAWSRLLTVTHSSGSMEIPSSMSSDIISVSSRSELVDGSFSSIANQSLHSQYINTIIYFHSSSQLWILLLLLLLLAAVTYNQVQPLRINYLVSQFKPYI